MSGGGRIRSRWQLDFSSRSGHGVDLVSPPGYTAGEQLVWRVLKYFWSRFEIFFIPNSGQGNMSHSEISREADPNLKIKRSWDVALGPFKQVPMNLFIMWMSGNTISIFPIMMVFMMMFRPFKTLFSVSQTFKGFEVAGSGVNFLGQKMVFILGNLANVALAMYKVRPHVTPKYFSTTQIFFPCQNIFSFT